jgi:hypothetical protein
MQRMLMQRKKERKEGRKKEKIIFVKHRTSTLMFNVPTCFMLSNYWLNEWKPIN